MSEYITDEAMIRCDTGQFSTKLVVSSSRMSIGGRPAASDRDCIPMKNVMPFGICNSGTYSYSNKAKGGCEKPCVLDLMDRYYLPDESQILSDAVEIVVPLEASRKKIREIIRFSVEEMTDIQHTVIKDMNYTFSDEISKQYICLWKTTENVYMICQHMSEVQAAITSFCTVSIQNCSYLKENDQDGEIVGRIESLLLKLKELAEERNVIAALPKAKEKHLITMESFGICRCGGILTFETSGQ